MHRLISRLSKLEAVNPVAAEIDYMKEMVRRLDAIKERLTEGMTAQQIHDQEQDALDDLPRIQAFLQTRFSHVD